MVRWAWNQLDPWLEIRRQAHDRCAAVRDPRTDRRSALGSLSRARAAAPCGCRRWRPTALRAASAAARPRGRDGARGRPARRDPAPARACQPRHHQRLPTRHRQQRDHRNRPWTAVADDLRQRRAADQVIDRNTTSVGRDIPLADPASHPRLATSTSLVKAGPRPAFVLARYSPLAAPTWLPMSACSSAFLSRTFSPAAPFAAGAGELKRLEDASRAIGALLYRASIGSCERCHLADQVLLQ
jgi:hypothetical protein